MEHDTTSSAHTAGPWYLYEDERPIVMATKGDNKYDVCELSCDNLPVREIEANARLIAAAPELLEHLKNIVAMARSVSANWENGNLDVAVRNLDRIASAAAAIASPEGRS